MQIPAKTVLGWLTSYFLLIQPSRVHNHTRRRLIDPTIVVVPIQRLNKSVVCEARVVVVCQLLSMSLTGNEVIQAAQSIRAAFTLAAANGVKRNDTVVQTHANELVRGICLLVAVLLGVIVHSPVMHRSRVGLGTTDDFCDELRTEGCDPGHAPVPLGVGRELREVGMLVVVVDTHCGQDGDDDVVVGEVRVERTAEWEVCCVVCNGAVDAAVAFEDVLVVQTGEEFL